MSDVSYSQFGEDQIIVGLLGDTKARLLDVGAWDPKTFSNSRLLIERGWSAVLVEFSPAPVRALIQEYGGRDDVQVLQAAMTLDGNGALGRFDISDDGLSTNTEAVRAKWDEKGGYYGHLWVPQLTLEWLFFQFGGGFEFVSIDTEGTSVDLAMQLVGKHQQRPKVLCVEHDDRVLELQIAAQKAGYHTVHANGTNVILAR